MFSYIFLKKATYRYIIEQAHEVVAQVPIEDIGVLILGHSAITITQPLIIECQENNTAVIFCDERHLPYSTILPISKSIRQYLLLGLVQPLRVLAQ
jgi:CRISPR-associated protein Cas1